ncbi:MAG: hypothetical protein ACRD4B_05360, partial [Acidobacteriota bacterium]
MNAFTYRKTITASIGSFFRHQWAKALLYFLVLLGFGFFYYQPLQKQRLSPHADGGLIQYAIVRNIQNVTRLDFEGWNDRRIYYPNKNTLAFTDHYYLHSLIGFPYYLLTRDPMNTYNFIFVVQLLIAISGYYALARKVSNNTTAIIITAIYFVYLPAFLRKHPQINFYGFIPWIAFFVFQFVQKKEVKYLYWTALALLFQSLVGIYHQLFTFMVAPIFLAMVIFHLHKTSRLKEYLSMRIIVHFTLAIVMLGAVLFLVNFPYLEFKRTVGIVWPLELLRGGSSDAASYFDVDASVFIADLLGRKPLPVQANNFLGVTGTVALIASLVAVLLRLVFRVGTNRNLNIVYLCVSCFIVVWLFSLGPHLKIMGHDTGIRLPYYYL